MQTEIHIPPLEFSPVGSAGAYPEWVRALDGHSGAYIIALRPERGGDAPIVYVGESHTGRLYDTLTRHFQTWKRAKREKNRWLALYGYGREDSPGVTYQRARCLVAVVLTDDDHARELQWKLIELLQPQDNIVGQVDESEERDELELAAVSELEELEDAPF